MPYRAQEGILSGSHGSRCCPARAHQEFLSGSMEAGVVQPGLMKGSCLVISKGREGLVCDKKPRLSKLR